MTDTDALERAVEATVERFGGIDVVVANAGIAPMGPVRLIDPAAFERTIEINLLGVWRTVRACLPHVIERRGYVLVVASLAAAVHGPGLAAYAASQGRRRGVRRLAALGGAAPRRRRRRGLLLVHRHRHGARRRRPSGARRPAREDARPGRQDLPGVRRGRGDRRGHRASAGAGWWFPAGDGRCWSCAPRWPHCSTGKADAEAAEADALFERDVAERGAEAASRPVGPGGEAAQGSEPPTRRRPLRRDAWPPAGSAVSSPPRPSATPA